MTVKKFLVFFFLSITFIIASISFLISVIIEYNLMTLILCILTFLCGLNFFNITIYFGNSKNFEQYYISPNHTYYLNEKNIFENANILEEKRLLDLKNI